MATPWYFYNDIVCFAWALQAVSKYVLPVMCTVSNRHKKMFVTFLFSVTRHRPLGRKPMTFLLLVQRLRALPLSYSRLVGAKATNHRCIPLGWSRSESVICDHSDHGRSNEPMTSTLDRDLAGHLIYQDLSDHGSLILIRIIPKEGTLHVGSCDKHPACCWD